MWTGNLQVERGEPPTPGHAQLRPVGAAAVGVSLVHRAAPPPLLSAHLSVSLPTPPRPPSGSCSVLVNGRSDGAGESP